MSCCTCEASRLDCALHQPTEEIIRDVLDHLDDINQALRVLDIDKKTEEGK